MHRNEWKFIGVKTYDPLKREEILDGYDEFQLNKLEFLNKYYTKQTTQLSYFNSYLNNIYDYEIEKKKDLMYFSSEEIEVMIESFIWSMDGTKSNLLSFSKKYCSYAKNILKTITVNPCDFISARDTTKNSKIALKRKIKSLDSFYEMCVNIELKKINSYSIISVVMARYGISGYEMSLMRYLKWTDIDRENKVVYIKDEYENIKSIIPIDDRFLFWLDKVPRNEFDTYIIGGGYGEEKVLASPSVYSRFRNCFLSIDLKPTGVKDLLFNRQIELLLEMRKTKQLLREDFKDVINIYYGSPTTENQTTYARLDKLVSRYQILTGDKVLMYTNRPGFIANPEDISEEDHEVVANRIIKDLDLSPVDIDVFKIIEDNKILFKSNNEINV